MEKLLVWLKVPSHISTFCNGLIGTKGMLPPIGGIRVYMLNIVMDIFQ